jgi:hypothetical protein
MTKEDNRDTLDLLTAELDFIEKGGYGRSVKTPWQPTSVFQDSLSCLNFADPERIHPCTECRLIDFVPPSHWAEDVPCHHIQVGPAGETVEDLERRGDQRVLEHAVVEWLRENIKRLEERGGTQVTPEVGG